VAVFGIVESALTQPRPACPSPLTADEERAASACLTLIRGCQLPDGAFAQVKPGDTARAPVWIAPYFANYAALALLAGYAHTQNREDLNRVGRWLAWCAQNQSAEGYWTDVEGTAAAHQSNGTVDAWDSSAALFLLVAGRYRRAGGQTTEALATATRRALACIESVTDADGLTWATPAYKVKFLMDNVEVQAGLRATETPTATAHADRIAKKLSEYWLPADQLFAFALHKNGHFEGGLKKPYPHGLAQLFGLAFVAPKTTAWSAVNQAFSAETGAAAAAGTEWWLIAASRLGDSEARAWRAKMVNEIPSFSPQAVYLSRPAFAALGLLEGADWMPKGEGSK
jgi:hypothetical protein